MRKESTGEQLDTLPDTAGACNGCRLIVLQAGNAGCQPGCTLLLLVRQRDAHCAARRGHPPAGFPEAAGRWQGLHYLRTRFLSVCPTAPLYNWGITQFKIMVSVPSNKKESSLHFGFQVWGPGSLPESLPVFSCTASASSLASKAEGLPVLVSCGAVRVVPFNLSGCNILGKL